VNYFADPDKTIIDEVQRTGMIPTGLASSLLDMDDATQISTHLLRGGLPVIAVTVTMVLSLPRLVDFK
jgi:hypothetical protein